MIFRQAQRIEVNQIVFLINQSIQDTTRIPNQLHGKRKHH